jgi:hypothetical protein
MPDTGLVVTKVGQSIISKLMPKFANRLLQWAVPLNEDHVIVRLEQAPYISIHYDSGSYELVLVFQISNLTPYKIEFNKYECEITLSSNPFFQVKDSEHFVLKQSEKKRIVLRHQLALSELKRAEAESSEGNNALYAQYTFSFTVNTRFGPQMIKPEVLCSVMMIGRHGQPKA